MSSENLKARRQQEYKRQLKAMEEQIKTWSLTEIHDYILCKNDDMVCNFLGFDAIMEKFIKHRKEDKAYPKGRREFEITDNLDRTQRGFDIVICLALHPRSRLRTMTHIQKFIKVYADVIHEYDKKTGEEYHSKLIHALQKGLIFLEQRVRAKKRGEANDVKKVFG